MFTYRLTPWDTKSLGFKTAELFLDDCVNSSEDIQGELKQIIGELKSLNVDFVYCRVNAQNFLLKKAFYKERFYFAEASLKVTKTKINKFEPFKSPKIELIEATVNDLAYLQNLAVDSFEFSRFHEDPNIKMDRAKDRYRNWVSDLFDQDVIIQIAKVGTTPIGTNIQSIKSDLNSADLILCGCQKGAELYVTSLWNEILLYNQSIGVKRINTLISAANINVVNLYSRFGFKVDKTLWGYHKFLSK